MKLKSLLLLLMMMVATTAAMNAQDDPYEQTADPTLTRIEEASYYMVYITNNDDYEDAEIYYRVGFYYDGWSAQEYTEWMPYDGEPIMFSVEGSYIVEAYAQTPGKTQSNTVSMTFRVSFPVVEKTAAPYIHCNQFVDEVATHVWIFNEDEDESADIYYRFAVWDDYDGCFGDFTEWMQYTDELVFSDYNAIRRFRLEAYAIAPGKTESDRAIVEFTTPDPAEQYHQYIADFEVDGIYYKYISDSTVMVSLNDTYDFPYVEPWGWEKYSEGPYSGDVVIPATVDYAGRTCTVVGIDHHAFMSCPLTSITLPNTLQFILSKAFVHATIESGTIYIPASVTNIETGAFADCYGLTTVQVAEDNPVYDSRDNCNGIVETATNTLAVGFINTTIPSTVTAIGVNAFAGDAYSITPGYYSGCPFTDFVIPDQVATIGEKAFFDCTDLKSLTIGNGVTTIGDWAFGFCMGIKRLSIPDAVTTIGQGAFSNCYGLNSVSIGNSVTSIGSQAFNNNDSIAQVICHAVTPPTTYGSVFDYGYSDHCSIVYEVAPLFVPAESVEAYRAHEEWGRFTHIVPFQGAGPGDFDGDGSIDINDVTGLIDRLLTGNNSEACADVNGDGLVDINDITDLINILLGK